MKKIAIVCFVPTLTAMLAAGLFAQGPRGGGFGGGFGPQILGAGPGGSRTPVTGAPYSATETTTSTQILANGNQISRTRTSSVARDSQGRLSTTETVTPPASSGKAPYTVQTIFDPVAGYRYVLNSSTMVAVQAKLPPVSSVTRPAHNPPANPNITSSSLGTMAVKGVAATGTQITENIPAGAIGNAQAIQVVRTTWVSSALGIPVHMKSVDPRFGTTEMELSNISTAEPSGTLFTVPSNYTIQQGGGRGPGGRGRGTAGAANFRRGAPPAPAQ